MFFSDPERYLSILSSYFHWSYLNVFAINAYGNKFAFKIFIIFFLSTQAFDQCPSNIEDLDAEIHGIQARADAIFQTDEKVCNIDDGGGIRSIPIMKIVVAKTITVTTSRVMCVVS